MGRRVGVGDGHRPVGVLGEPALCGLGGGEVAALVAGGGAHPGDAHARRLDLWIRSCLTRRAANSVSQLPSNPQAAVVESHRIGQSPDAGNNPGVLAVRRSAP